MIPTAKLFASLRNVDVSDALKYGILISTGAYCPIHNAHIDVFEKTKQTLEQKLPLRVVAGYISPTADAYVKPKLNSKGYSAIKGTHRVEMVRITTASSNYLSESGWEAAQGIFKDFDIVVLHHVQHLVAAVRAEFGSKMVQKLQFFYLCGTDHVKKCGLHLGTYGKFCDGIVAVSRPGSSLDYKDELPPNFHVVEDETADISSTLIRQLLIEGKPCSHLLPPGVGEYMKANNITVKSTKRN